MDNHCCGSAFRSVWLPIFVCVLSLAPYLPLLWPDERVLEADDYQSYQLPARQFAQQEILNGRFPLWMPSLGAGTPLHAGQQAALTSPLVLPFLLLPSVNYGLRLCVFVHLLVGYWGQYFLARRFELSPGAAALSALITTLSGFAIGHLLAGHLNHLFAIALFPWLFLALSHFLARPAPLTAAGLTICGALLLLTGHPQMPYYALLFGTFWGLVSLIAGPASPHRLRTIGWTLAAALVAVLIVLVQWLPTAELFADGHAFNRRGQTDFFDIAALRPPELLILAVPNATGNPYAHVPMFMGGGWRFHEKACYVGLLPLALAAFGFTRRRVAGWQWGFLAVSLVSVLIALGNGTPVMGWLTHVLPGLGQFRAPARVLSVTTVLVALLAGRGLDDLFDAVPAAGRLRQLTLGSVIAAALLGSGVSCYLLRDFLAKYTTYAIHVVKWEYVVAVVLALGSAGALLLAVRLAPRWRLAAQLIVLAMLTLDLWVSQARHIHLVEPASNLGDGEPSAQSAIRFAPMYPDEGDMRYSNAIGVLSGRPWSTISTNDGGMLPASFERLSARFLNPARHERYLRLSACDYLYESNSHIWGPVPDPLPRVRVATAEDVAEFIAQTGEEHCHAAAGTATVLEEMPERMTVRVQAAEPTVLIVADCYYPGWQAVIDGRPEHVEAVHGVFRGVTVPAGEHEVQFRYVSWPFRAGLMASVVGWLLLSGMFGLGIRQRKDNGFEFAQATAHANAKQRRIPLAASQEQTHERFAEILGGGQG